MSTHNIQTHDKIKKKSLNICFLELLEELCRVEKRVRIIHGKGAIRDRAMVTLYAHGCHVEQRYVIISATFPDPENTHTNRHARTLAFGHVRPAKIQISLRIRQSDQNLHWVHFGYLRMQTLWKHAYSKYIETFTTKN